jgi:hypothetical protein
MKNKLEKQAKCEIKVKLLVNEVQPLRQENRELKTEIKQLNKQMFKQEMYTYGVGILGIIIIFMVARKAFQFRYKKEFQVEIAGTRYEETNQTRMGPANEGPELQENERLSKKRNPPGSPRSALSDARRARRERNMASSDGFWSSK